MKDTRFLCQDCLKPYTGCKCTVYQSYFRGRGRLIDAYGGWKKLRPDLSEEQKRLNRIRRHGKKRLDVSRSDRQKGMIKV